MADWRQLIPELSLCESVNWLMSKFPVPLPVHVNEALDGPSQTHTRAALMNGSFVNNVSTWPDTRSFTNSRNFHESLKEVKVRTCRSKSRFTDLRSDRSLSSELTREAATASSLGSGFTLLLLLRDDVGRTTCCKSRDPAAKMVCVSEEESLLSRKNNSVNKGLLFYFVLITFLF